MATQAKSVEQILYRKIDFTKHYASSVLTTYSNRICNRNLTIEVKSISCKNFARFTSLGSPLCRIVTWIRICSILNHRKKKTDPSRLIPLKQRRTAFSLCRLHHVYYCELRPPVRSNILNFL